MEKLLVNRVIYYLENNNLLPDFQFGLREGRSCELTLQEIMSFIAFNIEKVKYTSLVSLDIKGAFDTVEWRYLVMQINFLIALKMLLESFAAICPTEKKVFFGEEV